MDSQQGLIIFCVGLAITLTCYIIALIKSKKGEMVFTANNWDMTLLLICPVLLLVGWMMQENPSLDTARYVLWSIAGACFVGTAIFSIVSNLGSIWKILCSILAKVFVVWLTMFTLMLLIAIFIVYVILSLVREHEEEEVILLKYDRFLKAYVGYRIS